MWIWIIAAIVVGLLAFIRLAPSDAAKWHTPVVAETDKTFTAGAIRVIDGDATTFEKLIDVAKATPRTDVLTGSVSEQMITFITRSRWIGFPDYTTVQFDNGQIKMHARLRFGRSDLGVNRARLEGWINKLNRR